jgi:hypothetical protein
MASPEHRQNMLSANYQNVGYAVETGTLNGENTVLVVEMLGSSVYAGALPSTGTAAAKTQQIAAAVVSSPPPTPSATPVLQKTNAPAVLNNSRPSQPAVQNQAFNIAPLISSANFSSNVAKTVVILFIFALLLDMLVIERKKVVRLVGHNLDHVFFLTLVLVMVTLIVKGAII